MKPMRERQVETWTGTNTRSTMHLRGQTSHSSSHMLCVNLSSHVMALHAANAPNFCCFFTSCQTSKSSTSYNCVFQVILQEKCGIRVHLFRSAASPDDTVVVDTVTLPSKVLQVLLSCQISTRRGSELHVNTGRHRRAPHLSTQVSHGTCQNKFRASNAKNQNGPAT